MKLNRQLVTGSVIGIIIVTMSLVSIFWTPYDQNLIDISIRLLPPQANHILGTDNFGRDIFSRVMAGGRNSLLLALCTVAGAAAAGCILGLFAGYLGGITGGIIMRVIDTLSSFPGIVLALLFVAVLDNSQFSLLLALLILFIPSYTRIMRTGAMQYKNAVFVQAEKLLGAGFIRITFIHILPNLAPSLLSASVLGLSNTILAESAMSYLGMGIQPPHPSWGRMLFESQAWFFTAPWCALAPGIFIMLTVLSFHLTGEGLRRSFGILPEKSSWHSACDIHKQNIPKPKNKNQNNEGSCLTVRDLTAAVRKNDKIFNILEKVSFKIDEGEILGIAGESGCGKSMTALCIANLLPEAVKITEGEINFHNRSLTALGEEEMNGIRGNEISFIFQDVRLALNPLMKAGDQIKEMLEINRKDDRKNDKRIQNAKNRETVLELLSSLGFGNPLSVYNAYPHQLSGGMCQRIITAMSIIKGPKLLLADEMSSSLDEDSQRRCLSLLLEMNRVNKMTLLIISHDLSIIHDYCGRFLVMYAGRIAEEGPSQLLYSPLHPYTKALVNAIPNKDKRGKNLENIPGKAPSVEDRPSGCPFSPRCPRAQDICTRAFPPLKEIDNRKVYCYFPETA